MTEKTRKMALILFAAVAAVILAAVPFLSRGATADAPFGKTMRLWKKREKPSESISTIPLREPCNSIFPQA